jgi:hypothetical protein
MPLFGAAFATALLTVVPARGDDKAICLSSFVDAQVARKGGWLRAAERALEMCGREVCPTAVRGECVTWLADVRASIPTIVLSATGPDGRDRNDVTVALDGTMLVHALDGRSIPIDPGEHRFRFTLPGGESAETSTVIRQGEHDRKVSIAFPRAATPTSPTSDKPPTRPVPAKVWALAGTGLVGVGLWAGFGYEGIFGPGGTNDLDKCRPKCPSAETNAARVKLAIADVSGGTALILLGLATYFFVTRPFEPAPVRISVDLHGASLRWSASF